MSCFSSNTVVTAVRPIIFDQEEEVLKYSGLELNKELFVYDVTIEMQGREYKIHTYRCGDENEEDLVLLHGYGGSSALYYMMLKDLSKRFRVFCMDFVGMGLSSKQKFECTTPEETLDFLLGSIEKWREALGLETFYLAGHSFGGYISGQYASRHQDRVKKLTLLSPVGVTKRTEEISPEEFKKQLGFFRRMLFGWFLKSWEKKITPAKFMRDHPWIGKMIVYNYVQKRFNLKDAEGKALSTFLLNMLRLPEGSEEAIHYILKPPFGSAYYPLEDVIAEELKMPIDCYFGEFDYMDTTGAKRVQYRADKDKFSYKILPKAAHQLTMQNPRELAQDIVASV